jgi:hypothetical protein
MRRLAVAIAAVGALLAGCGGSSAGPAPDTLPSNRPAPNLSAFLNLPVATPSACPSGTNATTVGRSSPWAGTVDVSVFLSPKLSARRQQRIGRVVRRDPLVRTTYFESAKQAYEEFERLYTCWTEVPRSQTPASYRLVLVPTSTLGSRDSLVRRLVTQPGVDSVSCAPALPCAARRRPKPSGSSSP